MKIIVFFIIVLTNNLIEVLALFLTKLLLFFSYCIGFGGENIKIRFYFF